MQPSLHNTQRLHPDKAAVQSLDRGLVILEAVAGSSHPLDLTRLAALLEVDRSSAFRLAATLKRRGFLTCPAGRKDYILGPAIWRLSQRYDWSGALVKISHDQLKMLAAETGETAHVAVRDGRHAVFIDHITSKHVIAVSGQTGERIPLHSTAHGKALLIDYKKPELQALFGIHPWELYTRQTIASIDELARACARIRAQGFAADDGEFGEGIRCVAAPIRDHDGAVIGSIGISAPVTRFPESRYKESGAQVIHAAAMIDRMLEQQMPADPARRDASIRPRRKRGTRNGA
jgi:IclR family acetate operon transcriptional repressor